MKQEADNNNLKAVNQIEQNFLQFQLFSEMRSKWKNERALPKQESPAEKDIEFERIRQSLENAHLQRMEFEKVRKSMERANLEQKGAWGGSRNPEEGRNLSKHIYEKPLNESDEDESQEEFHDKPYRFQGRGFTSGVECFPKGKQFVNRKEEHEFDEFRELEAFNNQSRKNFRQINSGIFDGNSGLSLGHRKETAVVDSIKEVITNATGRMEDMTANKRQGEQFNRTNELFPSLTEQQSHRDTEG
jgi:hypothetical protein